MIWRVDRAKRPIESLFNTYNDGWLDKNTPQTFRLGMV